MKAYAAHEVSNMPSNTAVMVRADTVHFVVFVGFSRTPQTGDHVMLSGCRKATVLREEAHWQRNRGTASAHPIEDHLADIFVDAMSTAE